MTKKTATMDVLDSATLTIELNTSNGPTNRAELSTYYSDVLTRLGESLDNDITYLHYVGKYHTEVDASAVFTDLPKYGSGISTKLKKADQALKAVHDMTVYSNMPYAVVDPIKGIIMIDHTCKSKARIKACELKLESWKLAELAIKIPYNGVQAWAFIGDNDNGNITTGQMLMNRFIVDESNEWDAERRKAQERRIKDNAMVEKARSVLDGFTAADKSTLMTDYYAGKVSKAELFERLKALQ